MKKHLLFALALAASVMSANAYEIGDYVFTNTNRYQVTGGNLITNGDFTNGFTGWTAVGEATAAEVFETQEGVALDGTNTIKVLDGQTALDKGVYQIVPVEVGGTYIVTMKVFNENASGYSDLDMTGGNTNYINAYYNQDGALATVDGTSLLFGEGGICGGYGFSFSKGDWVDVAFAIDCSELGGGNIIVDLRGLSAGLEIANVEVHQAQMVYDIRDPQERIDWINTIINSGVEFVDEDALADLQEAISEAEQNIEAENWDEMKTYMDNVEDMLALFLEANAENTLDFIATTDGSGATGNSSANWMNWTGKYSKLPNEYNGKAPWSWTTDRWCHKTGAANSPMSIQWMRGAGSWSSWNNIATLTTKLDKGTYFFGVSGSGGMMTLNKDRWARSMALPCAETKLFFNGDTVVVDTLDPAKYHAYLQKFEVAEDGTELTLGIICNQIEAAGSGGFDVNFLSPVLYKMMVEGQLTEAEKAYLDNVETQLNALKGRIDVANGYLAEDQTSMPWGKEALAEGAEEAQARYDAWAALSQDEILDMMYNYETLSDTIMNSGVRFLNNNYITPFQNMNKPLTDMPGAIKAAGEPLTQRIYASGDKATLEALIASAQALYDEKVVAPFSSEDSLALVDKKIELENGVVAFKASAKAEVAYEISFGTDEEPQSIVMVEDPTGETETYWYLQGEKGTMMFTNATEGINTDASPYCMGHANGYANYLRVGGSAATVDLSGLPKTESDIVKVSFDMYYGNLNGKQCGFFLANAAGECIASLCYSKYSNNIADYNGMSGDLFGMMEAAEGETPLSTLITGVGSSSASNDAIAAANNRTTFEVILDFGAREKYMIIDNAQKGSRQSKVMNLSGDDAPAKFILYSNYSNADRRSWFKNFKVTNIAAEPTAVAGVSEAKAAKAPAKRIENGTVVIEKDGKVYTAAGAQLK